ncbi:polyketide synthase [Enhygromyxa salina]|uniref:Polyketide synthase n=1 Tax=Enhygromyxa salina TaxID=215803 RepID=A0A0C2CUK8_9BACT|nr:polyketide synthase dehydratase domain-containing protein [Enhygromyxa salina]KIG11582.1 polyketide synthase [Enhygromyxa salina]
MTVLPLPSVLASLRCRVALTCDDPVLRDHHVHGVRIMPGVTFLDMLWRILAARGVEVGAIELRRCVFRAPASVDRARGRELLFEIGEGRDGGQVIVRGRAQVAGDHASASALASALEAEPREHFVADLASVAPLDPHAREQIGPRGPVVEAHELDQLYAMSRGLGTVHGPFMRGLGSLREHADGLHAALELGDEAAGHVDDFFLHPALLDCATLLPSIYFARTAGTVAEPVIPVHIAAVRGFRRPRGRRCHVWVPRASCRVISSELSTADLYLLDEDGELLASLLGLSFKRVRERQLITRLEPDATPLEPSPAPAPAALDRKRVV